MVKRLAQVLPLFFLFSFRISGAGDVNYHLIGNTKSKFEAVFSKGRASGYFYYDELVRTLLPEFKGLPYGAGSNGGAAKGQTAVNFTSFDCVTFVESFWSMCRTLWQFQKGEVKKDADPIEVFTHNLNRIRYFGGENCGIEERIHYFTQQMLEMERAGFVFNVAIANGDVWQRKINYISSNPAKYGEYATSQRLKSVETVLNQTENYFYTAKNAELYFPLAQNGDIIAFATDEPGLDVTHTGIITVEDGEVLLSHASSYFNKVVYGQSLSAYLRGKKGCTGIFVFRPVWE